LLSKSAEPCQGLSRRGGTIGRLAREPVRLCAVSGGKAEWCWRGRCVAGETDAPSTAWQISGRISGGTLASRIGSISGRINRDSSRPRVSGRDRSPTTFNAQQQPPCAVSIGGRPFGQVWQVCQCATVARGGRIGGGNGCSGCHGRSIGGGGCQPRQLR
jgi:hypothetical protein